MASCQSARTNSCCVQVEDSNPNLNIRDENGIPYIFPCIYCLMFWAKDNSSDRHPNSNSITRLYLEYLKIDFEHEFKSFIQNNRNKWNIIWNLIAAFLEVSNRSSGLVQVRNFIRLVGWFGCVKKIQRNGLTTCLLFDQIQNLIDNGYVTDNSGNKSWWFAGHMTMEESKRRLKNQHSGTFLLRFSESLADEGGFSYAVKRNDGTVSQYQILQGKPSCGREEYNGSLRLQIDEEPEITFRSITEMANHILGMNESSVCPNLPLNSTFQGNFTTNNS